MVIHYTSTLIRQLKEANLSSAESIFSVLSVNGSGIYRLVTFFEENELYRKILEVCGPRKAVAWGLGGNSPKKN